MPMTLATIPNLRWVGIIGESSWMSDWNLISVGITESPSVMSMEIVSMMSTSANPVAYPIAYFFVSRMDP